MNFQWWGRRLDKMNNVKPRSSAQNISQLPRSSTRHKQTRADMSADQPTSPAEWCLVKQRGRPLDQTPDRRQDAGSAPCDPDAKSLRFNV
jgi:hypothetical protein